MGDHAKREHHSEVLEALQRRRKEVLAAGVDFRPDRLVLGWNAAHGIDDGRINERQAVIRPGFVVALGEAERLQRAVKKVAGVVAGERATRLVGAAKPGRQSDDEKCDGIIASLGQEGGNGRVVPPGFAGAPVGNELVKARAKRTVARRLGFTRRKQVS